MESHAVQPPKAPITETYIQEALNFGDRCMHLWGGNGEIIDVSLATLDFFEVPTKETFLKTYDDFSPEHQPDGRPSKETMREWIRRGFSKVNISFDWLHRKKSGRYVDCRINLFRAEYLGEKVVCAFVAERSNGVEDRGTPIRTRADNDHVHVMMDLAPIGCFFFDGNFDVIDCNRHVVAMYEMGSKGEMNGSILTDNAPPRQPNGEPSGSYAQRQFDTALRDGMVKCPWTALTKHGREFTCEVTAVRIMHRGEPAVMVYLRETDSDFELVRQMSTERTLRQRLQAMLDSTPMLCAIFDENGNVLEANQGAADLFGFSDRQAYIENFPRLVPEYQPDGSSSMERVMSNIREVIRTGRKLSNPLWMHQTLDGQPIPTEATLVPVRLDDRDLIIAYAKDLREHFKLKEIQDTARQRLQAMLDSSPLLCAIFNANGNIQEANQGAANLLGLPDKQIYIDRFYELCPERQPDGSPTREKMLQVFRHVLDKGRTRVEWMHKTLDGQPIPCDVHLERVRLEEQDLIIAHARDLREHLTLKAIQDTAQQRLQAMLDASPMLCTLFDENYGIQETNQMAASILGLPDKQVFIDRFYDLCPERQPDGSLSRERVRERLREAFDTGQSHFEWTHQTLEGVPVPCEVYLKRVNLGDQKTVIAYVKDIREQKEMLDRIEAAFEREHVANSAKSRFLSNMSHEIRTPMNAISGMIAIALESDDIDRKNYCLGKIEGAASYLLGIINQILDMSKIEADKFEMHPSPFDLRKMTRDITGVQSIQVEEKGLTMVVDIDRNIPRLIVGDEIRLSQVLTNLLTNAVKFTPRGGRVGLTVGLTPDQENLLRVEVSDTGIGIAPENQARVFGAFEQAETDTAHNFGGTGLGLTISKRIVEMMGGAIWAESEPGKGSRFIFTLPFEDGDTLEIEPEEADQAEEGPAGLTPGCFADRTVLLVEDVDINREIVVSLLEPTGLRVECAEDGEHALRLFTERQDRYDMIFMDLQMPNMDGISATRHIRALGTEKATGVPIVAMTANAFQEDIDRCLACGMNDHLGKPLDFKQVAEKLRKYLPD